MIKKNKVVGIQQSNPKNELSLAPPLNCSKACVFFGTFHYFVIRFSGRSSYMSVCGADKIKTKMFFSKMILFFLEFHCSFLVWICKNEIQRQFVCKWHANISKFENNFLLQFHILSIRTVEYTSRMLFLFHYAINFIFFLCSFLCSCLISQNYQLGWKIVLKFIWRVLWWSCGCKLWVCIPRPKPI